MIKLRELEETAEIAKHCLRAVSLHGDETLDLCQALREADVALAKAKDHGLHLACYQQTARHGIDCAERIIAEADEARAAIRKLVDFE